jgi:hypothetical protein
MGQKRSRWTVGKRVVYQLIAVIVLFSAYIIGKSHLANYDFSGIPSFFYTYFNVGNITLLAAWGFSFIGFTVIEQESNRRLIHKILFVLLQVLSFAIVVEFYMIKVFQYPVSLQLISLLLVIILLILSTRKPVQGSSL